MNRRLNRVKAFRRGAQWGFSRSRIWTPASQQLRDRRCSLRNTECHEGWTEICSAAVTLWLSLIIMWAGAHELSHLPLRKPPEWRLKVVCSFFNVCLSKWKRQRQHFCDCTLCSLETEAQSRRLYTCCCLFHDPVMFQRCRETVWTLKTLVFSLFNPNIRGRNPLTTWSVQILFPWISLL